MLVSQILYALSFSSRATVAPDPVVLRKLEEGSTWALLNLQPPAGIEELDKQADLIYNITINCTSCQQQYIVSTTDRLSFKVAYLPIIYIIVILTTLELLIVLDDVLFVRSCSEGRKYCCSH